MWHAGLAAQLRARVGLADCWEGAGGAGCGMACGTSFWQRAISRTLLSEFAVESRSTHPKRERASQFLFMAPQLAPQRATHCDAQCGEHESKRYGWTRTRLGTGKGRRTGGLVEQIACAGPAGPGGVGCCGRPRPSHFLSVAPVPRVLVQKNFYTNKW